MSQIVLTALILVTGAQPQRPESDGRGAASDAKPKIELELKYDLSAGSTGGRCVLSFRRDEYTSCGRVQANRGEEVILDIRFKPRSPELFYNPFFDPSIPLPGCLAIFDSEGQYLGNSVPPCCPDAARSPADRDWFFVGGGYVGTTRRLTAGRLPSAIGATKSSSLPSGTYYFQVILYKRFILFRNRPIAELLKATQEVCRSNIVELRIVDDQETGMPHEKTAPNSGGHH